MADVNSNININFNTDAALAQLRSLQAGLSRFHQSLAEGNLAASNAQKGLNAQLLQSVGATGKFSASQVKVAGSTLAFTSALEKNKLSLREYYRYTMAAATANTRVMGKAFAQEREIINRARRDRVKALQAQYIQMNKSNSGFMDAIRVMPKSLAMANGKFTELGTRIQYAAQRQQFLNQLLKQGSTQLLNFGKNTQWAGRQLMVGLTMPLALFGSMAAKTFRELEEEIIKFKRVYGDAFTNDAETDAAVANIRRLATEYTKYGVSVTKTVEMAATAAAAGFSGSALNAQVETATKLAVLGQIEQQQALETTISLQSAFGISSEELAKKIDFLNAVENQTLLSIEDLTIAIPKAAPVVKQLGGTVEDLAFFLTAMKEGGINASEGANALKSGLASLINPSDKAAKFLGNLGVNIRGIVEANKGDIKSTVVGFAQALDTLDPLNRARAIEQLFGKFQFSRLSTLFQNVTKDGSQASRAFDLAGKSVEELAIISEREMKKIEDSVGVKFQAAVEKFKQDIMPLGKVFLEALTPVVKFFGDIFEKFNGLSDSTKKVIAIIVGAVAGLGPVVLMTFGLLANGIANVIKFFSMLRGGIARLNGQTNVMGAGFNYMTQEQIENAASSQQLHQTHTRLIEVFNVEAGSVNALASSYNSLSTQMRAMASQNPALFAGGMGGAKRAVSKMPPVRKYKDGVLTVPGPKGAGDVVPAMLSPGEAVIPTKTTDKYRGLITAMFNDKVPGFMSGRIPAGPANMSLQDLKIQRVQQGSKKVPSSLHSENQSGAVFVGMPKSAAEASQSRQILEKISNTVKSGRFGSLPPTNFGTLLQPFSGRSFPARGVGGVYRKPNGKVVVVKPTIDEKTALAEVRATQIAREVHGLVSPKQSIKTMLDPTDPSGQRKFIVIESPYDPRIAAATGKFTKSDMIKQLVASTLRGDKDLQKANLSGKVLSDVGTAGVFDKASGFRDFAKVMPTMEQQAIVNLLGVKGGARKFFAQETSSIAAGMKPDQYDAAIKKEINKSIPRLEKLLKSWDKDLDPTEKIVYGNMLERLKAGKDTDWASLQPMHARAGEGIKHLMAGEIPDASRSIVEQQLAKYNLPQGTQGDLLVDDLKRNAQTQFVKELNNLDPARRAVVEAAWKGGKVSVPPSGKEQAFNTPRQTAFLDEISKMVPVRVGNEIKYVHKDDYDSFKADPDGRARYARSSQQVIDNMLYRMGVTKRGDSYVASGKFSGRFAGIDHFKTDLKSTGKTAGGGSGTLSSVVRSIANAQKAEFNARVGDPLKTKTGKAMLAAGFTPDKIRYFLRPELSHIIPTESLGIGGRQGALKMKTGEAQYDSRLVNTFMSTKKRSANILNWNSKGNPLNLTPLEIEQYKKASDFMSRGLHPATAEQRALVGKAAELDQRVFGFTNRGGKAPANLLPKDIRLSQALTSILSDKAFKPSQIMNLAATDPSQVLVKPGEYKLDKNAGTLTKLTTANTGPKPPGAQASTGKRSDRRLSTEGPGQTTVTKSQAMRIRGRDAGDPNATLTPYQRQELKKIKTKYPSLDESQLQKILQRKLKADKALLDSKERELAVAKKAERRAQQLPKQEAARQAKLDKIESQRQSRLLEASRYQDKANKMNAKIDKERTTRQARIARQEKVGRFSGGASMALGTAGMGLMMAGQQNAGMAVMGASAVAGMAPMLMNPYVAAGTAVVALAAGFYMLDRAAKKAAEAQSKMVDATFSSTEKMKAIGELTGNVGASEIMSRRRSGSVSDRYTTGFERGKQQFGTTFLENAAGKDIMVQFVENMKSGTDTAARQMAVQLAGYISDGVMSAEQAHSVASQIGINLNNQTITSQISGQLLELVGPSGEDLLINPLEVRLKLVNEQQSLTDDFKKELQNWADSSEFIGIGEGKKFAAASAAAGAQNLEFNQAQIDSLNVQYDKELKILEAQKAATTDKAKQVEIDKKIEALEAKRIKGTNSLRANGKKILDDQIEIFRITQTPTGDGYKGVEKAYFDSLKGQVREKYKGQSQEAFVDNFLEDSSDLESKELEVKINTIVASGQMPPSTATSLMAMFAGKEKLLDKFLNATTTLQDPGKVSELINALGGVKGEGVARKILTEIASKDPKEADKLMSTIALMQKMNGKEINITTFFQEDGLTKLQALQLELEAVEKIETPITRKVIGEIDTDGDGTYENMDELLAVWDQWENLDDETKKTVIQEYITLLRTITPDQVDAEVAKKIAEAGSTGNIRGAERAAEYYSTDAGRDAAKRAKAANDVMQAVKQDQEFNKAGKVGDSDSSGGKDNPLSFLDSLAARLKQVRDNSFNALKPVESLLAAFTDKKTQDGAFSLFDGIQNRLSRLGAGKDFRDAIASMSAEDFSKVASLKGDNALFTFAKGKAKSKDTITGLTKTGKAVNQGYNEANLGDFNLANQDTVKNIQDQTKAYNTLISSGLSASEALEVVGDQSQAAAIAAGAIKKGTPEWKQYIASIKESNTALERQGVLNKALRANEEFSMYKEMPKLVSQMKELGYGAGQIDEVLADPQLAKFLVEDLKDGKLDAQDLAEYLKNIEAKKIIDIQVQLNKGDLSRAAEEGRQIVDELFAAQEGLIRTGQNAIDINKNNESISSLELQIAPFSRSIELLSEQVNDFNRQLEMNPLFGDRAIQKIQDENSSLSNDLAVISNAAEQVNKRYDDQAEALQKVSDINQNILDQQKEQIGLADAITSGDISAAARAVQEIRAGNASRFADAQSKALQQARENALGSLVNKGGLNEEQISKKQFENSQKIYAMENDPARIALLKNIRDTQDDIYNIEENSIDPLQERIDKLVYSNTLLQGAIDKELANIEVLGKTRGAWDKINAEIDYFAAAQVAADNPGALAGLLAAADTLKTTWTDILAKMSQYAKGVPAEVAVSKATLLKVKTEEEKKAEQLIAQAAKIVADDKFKEDAVKRTQGFNAPIGKIERSLAGYAKGGMVSDFFARGGYASGTDTVPAMLTPGEYVLRKDAVEKYGIEHLDAMNVGKYADGGKVSKFESRPKYGTKTKPKEKDNWFDRYVESKKEDNKIVQGWLNKSPLTSWMDADVTGVLALLKSLNGEGTGTDKFNAALLPLNFIGAGKIFGSGTTTGAKQLSPLAKKLEALNFMTRAIHNSHNPNLINQLVHPSKYPGSSSNALGDFTHFATNPEYQALNPGRYGPFEYKPKLNLGAVTAVLRSKGFASQDEMKKYGYFYGTATAKYGDEGIQAAIKDGFIGMKYGYGKNDPTAEQFSSFFTGDLKNPLGSLVKMEEADSLLVKAIKASGILKDKKDPGRMLLKSKGGLVPKYFASGGYAMGTDTVPSMLTPGEFVMSKYAVDKYGVENMKAINSGSSVGDSVYNYNLNLNVKSDANPDDIARAVMVQIKSVDAQRIRGARF
jgi:TP901 family phage tail tape measure protein